MIPSSTDKFCIECKFAQSAFEFDKNRQRADKMMLCTNPKLGLSLVTKEPRVSNCLFERSLSGKCGPNALLYEQIAERNQ